jgi:nucleoside-diphosphate-sugar epimerase
MIYILITGGAGFIASSLADTILNSNKYFVVAIDNFLSGSKKNISKLHPHNYKFLECDVNNFEELNLIMSLYKFDYVFHYAAVVGVQRTLDFPLKVLNDIEGIKNVMLISKNNNVKRVFFSSSSEVYGEPVEFPQNEFTTPLNSKLPYAIVKNIGEAFLKSYNKEFGLNYTIFRFFNTYGIKQSTDFVISKFLFSALKNDNITIFGDGLQKRTFCYIDDNIETVIRCLENNLIINEVINIGSDIEFTILDLAHIIIEKTNSTSKIIHLPALAEGDMTRRLPDNTKMKNILKKELTTLDVGIEKIISNIE